MARWGFSPDWARQDDKAMAAKMINARSETVDEKKSFQSAWQKQRRCLVPVNGFYEWKKSEDGTKQPYFIHSGEQEMFYLGGLWSKGPAGVTFTILTKDADGEIKNLHHRSPVIIGQNHVAQWFGKDLDQAVQLVRQSSASALTYHAVGSEVGKVANDDENLIRKIA